MSLRGLAAASGVSPSLMSQIETGKVEPSLSTLRKIAIALDVPLFLLVLENGVAPAQVVPKAARRRVLFPKAGLHYEIVHSDFQKKMGIMVGTLSPGGATSEMLLPHQGEECLIVLEGTLTVEMGGEPLLLTEGDSLYFDSSVPHRLRNAHDTPCRFYLIITPPKF